MPLNAALKQLLEAKLAHRPKAQWELPIDQVRKAFRELWTPAMTGEPVSLPCIADVMIPGAGTPIARDSPFRQLLEEVGDVTGLRI